MSRVCRSLNSRTGCGRRWPAEGQLLSLISYEVGNCYRGHTLVLCYLTLDLERLRHERVHCSAFELRLKDASRSSSINSLVAAGLCCADCSKMALDGQRCRLGCHAVVVVLNRMLINLYSLGLFD